MRTKGSKPLLQTGYLRWMFHSGDTLPHHKTLPVMLQEDEDRKSGQAEMD